MNSRIDYEIAVLGACLIDQSAFPQVMDILAPKNFTQKVDGENHQEIYAAMQSLYANSPITLLTMAHALKGKSYVLADYASRVCTTVCIKHHAYMVLEFSIRENFIKTLQGINTSTVVVMAAINELIDEALDGDIFEIIEHASSYLNNIGATAEGELILQLQSQIDTRIEKIKEAAKIETLFNHLQNLVPAASSNSKMAMQKITELTKQIIVTGSLTQPQINQLLAI